MRRQHIFAVDESGKHILIFGPDVDLQTQRKWEIRFKTELNEKFVAAVVYNSDGIVRRIRPRSSAPPLKLVVDTPAPLPAEEWDREQLSTAATSKQ